MAGDIPKWAKGFLDLSGCERIEAAVKKAEVKTQGEIVPMIVKESSSMGFLPVHIFLMLSVLNLALLSHMRFEFLILGILVSAVLSPLAAKWPLLQRLLIPKADQEMDVFHRAHYEFHQHGLGKTQEHTGILIFVSLMEHKCVVLADKGISDKVDKKIWEDVIATLVSHIKSGQPAEGMAKAVEMCGGILESILPATSKNTNELQNRLHLLS